MSRSILQRVKTFLFGGGKQPDTSGTLPAEARAATHQAPFEEAVSYASPETCELPVLPVIDSATESAQLPASAATFETTTRQHTHPRATVTGAAESASEWRVCGEAITGLAHRREHLPCQDAVAWRNAARPILVLSDGAGSASVSERGAHALVAGISRLLTTLENDLARWLDSSVEPPPEQSQSWAERLRLHAQGLLEDLAHTERRSVRDFRATLLVAVIGRARSFWWQVGDGAIVARQGDALLQLGVSERGKGEFANQTCFIDSAGAADVQWGLLPSDALSGMALMSDGGAERLVSADGRRIAPRLGQWLSDLYSDQLTPDKIALAFHEPAMWERTSLDDRAIVLAAREHRPGSPATAT